MMGSVLGKAADCLGTLGCGLQALGLVLEIVGVFLMAHAYLGLAQGAGSKLRLLLSVVLLGRASRRAKGAEVVYQAGFSKESYTQVIRGLALIGLGFVAQLIGLLLAA